MRFLFITTGPGEYAGTKSFAKYVMEQGDRAIIMASENVLPIIRAEMDQEQNLDIETFSIKEQDIQGRIKVLCDFYNVDVLVFKPSRGQVCAWERPENIKVAVTMEDNLQFMGVGASYRLQKVMPEWLDIYAVVWPEEVYNRALMSHYDVSDVDVFPVLKDKVKAVGWIPCDKIERNQDKDSYAFSYFGSGSNFNQGILPKFVRAYFNQEKERGLVSISADVVTGHYPKLDVLPVIPDYDSAIGNAYEAYLHEGYGSICKCMANQVPVMSFCSLQEIKQAEIQPLEDCGLIHKFDRPALAEDMDVSQLQDEISKFKDMRTDLLAAQKKYFEDGRKNLYKLILQKYEDN